MGSCRAVQLQSCFACFSRFENRIQRSEALRCHVRAGARRARTNLTSCLCIQGGETKGAIRTQNHSKNLISAGSKGCGSFRHFGRTHQVKSPCDLGGLSFKSTLEESVLCYEQAAGLFYRLQSCMTPREGPLVLVVALCYGLLSFMDLKGSVFRDGLHLVFTWLLSLATGTCKFGCLTSLPLFRSPTR